MGRNSISNGGGEPMATVIAAVSDLHCQASMNKQQDVFNLVNSWSPAAVIHAGDLAYNGYASEYTLYNGIWGSLKSKAYPCPGNHEYYTANAPNYGAYFGSRIGSSGHYYYSADIAGWHFISLDMAAGPVDGTAGSAQYNWLKADLEANTTKHTVVFWHKPRFSAEDYYGDLTDEKQNDVWALLVQHRQVEFVINGHCHTYQRWKRMNNLKVADSVNGIREFIFATGGYAMKGNYVAHANCEVEYGVGHGGTVPNPNATTGPFGAAKITLDTDSYKVEYFLTNNYNTPLDTVTQTTRTLTTPPPPTPPVASFTVQAGTKYEDLPIQFTDTSTNTPTAWTWAWGDQTANTTGTATPTHTFLNPGTYYVTLTATNGGGSNTTAATPVVITLTVPVQPPVCDFIVNTTSPTVNQPIQFTDNSSNSPTGWVWVWGDGSANGTTRTPTHTFTLSGTKNVQLTANNTSSGGSAGTPITKQVVVAAAPAGAPVSTYTANPPVAVKGRQIQFTDTSINSPDTWAWNFGDGTTSTLQSPTHTYATTGDKTLTFRASRGATQGNLNSVVIRVYLPSDAGWGVPIGGKLPPIVPTGPPVANFTSSPASPPGSSPGQAVSFTDTSTGNPTSWLWEFDKWAPSNQTTQNAKIAFTIPATKQVYLTATNQYGSSTVQKSYIVGTQTAPTLPPVANYVYSPINPYVGQPVTFSDQSTNGPILQWEWIFVGETVTSSLETFDYAFQVAGSKTVQLRTRNAVGWCTTPKTITFTVTAAPPGNVSPNSTFTMKNSSGVTVPSGGSVVKNTLMSFQDTSTGTPLPTIWSWNFGDGATSTVKNPTHQYTVAGTYTINMTSTNTVGSDPATAQTVVVTDTPPPGGVYKLKYAPPNYSGYTNIDATIIPSGNDFNLNAGVDYKINLPTGAAYKNTHGMRITGGRNVVIIGGTIDVDGGYNKGVTANETTSDGWYAQGMKLINQTGTVFIEGVRLINSRAITNPVLTARPLQFLTEGIQVETTGPAKVYLQNIWIENMEGQQSENHADGIQCYKGPASLYVDRVTMKCGYQALTLNPHNVAGYSATNNDWALSHMDIYDNPVSVGGRTSKYLCWLTPPPNTLTCSNVYTYGGLGNYTPGSPAPSWAAMGVTENTRATTGDPYYHVNAYGGLAGFGYVSPGYEGTVTPVAPQALFSVSASSFQVGGTLVITNSSTGTPTPTYLWDFGGSEGTSTATSPTHTYNTVGGYTIRLTATNSAGQSVNTYNINVTAPPPVSGTKLTWAPPSMVGATTLVVNAANRKPTLDNTKDYIIQIPDVVTWKDGIDLNGGRNIVIIGAEFNFAQNYATDDGGSVTDEGQTNRGLYIHGGTSARVVHLEGLLFAGTNLYECMNVNSSNTVVQVQNTRCDHLKAHLPTGSAPPHHGGDFLQVFIPPTNVVTRFDRITVYTDYQCYLDQGTNSNIDIRNSNVTALTSGGALLIGQYGTYGTRQRACTNAYFDVGPRSWTSVIESPWNTLPGVIQGSHADFVPVGVAGRNYTSPGYV